MYSRPVGIYIYETNIHILVYKALDESLKLSSKVLKEKVC